MLTKDARIIFKAAAIEDEIRKELLLLRDAKGSAELIGRQETICLVLIPRLADINRDYFKNSPAIHTQLEALKTAVNALRHQEAWDCFTKFADAPGTNFGTWAI